MDNNEVASVSKRKKVSTSVKSIRNTKSKTGLSNVTTVTESSVKSF